MKKNGHHMNSFFQNLMNGSKPSVAYMIDEITHICRNMDKRAPGSAGERQAAEYMAGVLRRDCGCDDVRLETFREHPSAFYVSFRLYAVFDTMAAVGYFIHPWLCIILGCVSLLLLVFQFGLYKPVIDRLLPERESCNVTAVRPCSGEVRRRVFLNGHMDASWEFPLNYRFGGVVFETPGVVAIIGLLYYLALSVCAICGAGSWTNTAALWGLLFIPFFALVGCTHNPRRVVDGANDDLSGCYMGIALLKAMEESGVRLEHTEIGVILTGSEEAGLRGAKAWCKAHKDGYRDVPTFILNYDTIHDPKYLMVNERNLNGLLKSDAALCEAFLQAAKDVGVPCRRGWVPPLGGATDTVEFTLSGFRSMGITGLNHKLEDYYHTRRDTWDNLDSTGLENCYRATVRMIQRIDEGELD